MSEENEQNGGNSSEDGKKGRRKLSGDLTYNSTPGGLERTLKAIITAQKPPIVDTKYIQTTLAIKGGTGSAQIGTLKKLGIIDAQGKPTKIYDNFRNDKLRSHASFSMLKNGYASIFAVNAHAHKASDDEVQNIIAQVTGLDREDQLITTIHSCFDKVKNFIDPSVNVYEPISEEVTKQGERSSIQKADLTSSPPPKHSRGLTGALCLTYQINIVLPQAGNIETYNMIFRSLRENILDWEK